MPRPSRPLHPLASRRAALALLATLAVACASDQAWQRDGATAADREREQKECFAQSGNTSGIMNWKTSRYIEGCMTERGWTRGPDQPAAAVAAPVPAPPTADASPAPQLSFDQCFERCRALTDRSKEACFDVCLDRKQ